VHGLQLGAGVAQAVSGTARQFLTDQLRVAIAIVLQFVPSSGGQVAVIELPGLVGSRWYFGQRISGSSWSLLRC
jgi:hypothetical protein